MGAGVCIIMQADKLVLVLLLVTDTGTGTSIGTSTNTGNNTGNNTGTAQIWELAYNNASRQAGEAPGYFAN